MPPALTRRRLLGTAGALGLATALPAPSPHAAASPDPADWPAVLDQARGQTVHWAAWAGDDKINRHIVWIGDRVGDRFGITLRHVKVADIAKVITRLLAERAAGRRDDGGRVDLLWINGENFLTAKDAGLLFGPFATALPNWRFVDPVATPTVATDFTVPTEGYESPWGLSQFTLAYDSARLPDPPTTLRALGDRIRANPGRFTYPAPPDFLGSSFLKQALYDLTPDPAVLVRPVAQAGFEAATAPLWAWLADIHPHLWRHGRDFPASGPDLRRLLADGEVDVYLSFHPSDASSAIAQGLVPPSVRTVMFEGGTLGNSHFVAIPATAPSRAGALVVADFLLSPDAQIKKLRPDVWGDDTVLSLARLSAEDRARLAAVPLGPATLPVDARPPALPEPHPSWTTALETAWLRRHGSGE
ncbi:ABC transporter substrate-binding protein [Roseospira visakhapatnamensis]|uniref:Putative thiamine transport system substrate-binding protein n=1 Tax=Roseospira visakhapatnamensis TaxID=390880 RepID=A0A7W6W8Z6_9PROT|nr:ABC transporter substrate-binding protein [Roseospira visakhapatnamensis]MBB4265369.1 putative thiamine transport system substrate-binding protein [Roseospira visakhapatnamensis]